MILTLIIVGSLLLLIGVICAVFFLAAPSHDDIIMIGHRGYSSRYPDNTKISFIEAAKHGSKGVETDVRRTSDGVYVLSHDSEAEFADGTTLRITESTYADLTAKPLKNDKSDDVAYLCTLREYLEVCKEYDMICFVELKGDYTDEQLQEIFGEVETYYRLDMCELQSFDSELLIRAQKLFPEMRFMLTWGADRGPYDVCFEHNFDIDSVINCLSPKMLREFHNRGLKVATWTCNDPLTLTYAYWYKVDYIESDVY